MAKIKEKDTNDKWKFWLAFKPFLSDKVKSKEPFILVNNVNIASNGIEVAKTFNEFFSNSVKNLEILEYQCEDNLHSRLSSNSVPQALTLFGAILSVFQAFTSVVEKTER